MCYFVHCFLYNKVFGPGRVDPFRAQLHHVRSWQFDGGSMKNGDWSKIQMAEEERSALCGQY